MPLFGLSSPLVGSERPRSARARLVEPLGANEVLGITLLVRPRPGSRPLPDLEHWQATPPGKRRFLSPEEFTDSHGAAQADLDSVAAFVAAQGMTVISSHAGRRSVTVQGTAAQMNAAFGISLNRYESPLPPPHRRTAAAGTKVPVAMQTHHGFDGPVKLPANLGGIVTAVIGLDNRGVGACGGSGDPVLTGGTTKSLPVATIAGYYHFPNSGAADQTIGVLAPSDQPTATNRRLAGYLSNDINNLYFPGLAAGYQTAPASINDVNLTVGTNTYSNSTATVRGITSANLGATTNGFVLEVTQDISTAATVAQGATINVYFTENSEQGLLVFLNRVLQPEGEKQPTVVTSSFWNYASDDSGSIGLAGSSGSVANVISTLFQQLALLGINVFNIAGDWGADATLNDGKTHVMYPGSDPWTTCCGGTIVGNVKTRPSLTFNEVVWSDANSSSAFGSSSSDFGATGGGVSGGGNGTNFPVPAYQTAAGLTEVTDSKNNTLVGRAVPDVAGMVSCSGFFVNGISYSFTGTSCVAPLYAGLAAVLRSAFGVALGFLNPTLYQLGAAAFNDITTGNNDSGDTPDSPYFTAGAGWDACTGWGSIDGTKLLNGIAGVMYTQTFYFALGKDNYGLDEVQNVAKYPTAFWLLLEGFTPAAAATAAPRLSGAFATLNGVTIKIGTAQPEIPSQESTPQRILFPCEVDFAASAIKTTAQGGIFPATGAAPIELPMTAAITVQGQSFTAATVFQLLPGADPFFTNINPSEGNVFYLSQDLRVFTATPGINATPIAGVGSPPRLAASSTTSLDTAAAFQYIQDLLRYLNVNYSKPAGTDPFTLFPDQSSASTGDSSVTPSTINPASPSGTPFSNYNFAVARVRLNGAPNTLSGKNVRVFFRLFATQSCDTDYQTNSTYPFTPDAAGDPGAPLPGTSNSTLPFYATGNDSANSDFGANTDYSADSVNNQPISIGSTGAVWAYYGCYLNVYPTSNTINGKSVQSLLAGTHHCLVAQIAFDDAPIVNSNGTTKSPENSDKLAQRNLQVTTLDNPGPASTHRVPQTFDLRPSAAPGGSAAEPLMNYPDELMIEWGETPVGSVASIFWPQVSASDVLALAKTFYSTHQLSAADANTIQCTVNAGVTYVPIPPGAAQNFAGLFTVDMRQGVVTGQEFNIVVRRLSSRRMEAPPLGPNEAHAGAAASGPAPRARENWRYVVGSFAVRIPVTTARFMLPPEENTLAIMKWRLSQTSPSDRWYPVLSRYVTYIAARVDGLGGNSGTIMPSPAGVPPAPLTGVKVDITFPPNFSPFLAGKPIEIRGNATWQPPGPLPVHSMQLSAFESRWNGISFGRWVHVNDFPLKLVPAGSNTVIWEHEVVPFDGMARYMLTAYAFGQNNKSIGSSEPLFLKAVE